ncbi:MAG: tRNA dihydrouridine synthase DusB [Gammaproteobacteria bacterium RIFOXYA12_FULL_61_12]|nr:MAG: tRNA dihydrouridine synthase DusB [Gammaproteobacteria bacterium RIFOXYA12_FULL_61_12]OGT90587.1 MAG: tRNA dihydrouridine synthase DusB [Gammaproteobacteria bacterium RIFOXYD12_FULL_61_37]
MRIGPHRLQNNLILAPMAGVTDKPFRALCRRLGAGLAVSEMISANSSLWGTSKSVRRLDHAGEPGPISVQILGADPVTMAEAARINVARGAQIIDINMGCPAKKVCKVAAGSALLRDEPLIGRILAAIVEAVDVPVTLKIRTGWDRDSRNAVRVARIAEESGIQALAVHGRTRACGFSGLAEYETIQEVKGSVTIPVIANGDIDSPEKAQSVMAFTGADGLMIGRAAQGRPWIFREISQYLATGARLPPPSPEWIRDLLLEHHALMLDFHGERQGVRIARKHIAWYSKTFPGGNHFRGRINQSESICEQRDLICGFFDRLSYQGVLAA